MKHVDMHKKLILCIAIVGVLAVNWTLATCYDNTLQDCQPSWTFSGGTVCDLDILSTGSMETHESICGSNEWGKDDWEITGQNGCTYACPDGDREAGLETTVTGDECNGSGC